MFCFLWQSTNIISRPTVIGYVKKVCVPWRSKFSSAHILNIIGDKVTINLYIMYLQFFITVVHTILVWSIIAIYILNRYSIKEIYKRRKYSSSVFSTTFLQFSVSLLGNLEFYFTYSCGTRRENAFYSMRCYEWLKQIEMSLSHITSFLFPFQVTSNK